MDTSKLPKSRAEAKAKKAKYYFTGEPCKHGHVAARKTKGACVECLKVEWRKAAETRQEYFHQYNRREGVKEKKHEWYEANRQKVIEAASTRPKHLVRQYKYKWRDSNLDKVYANVSLHRRRHRQATPPWLTKEQRDTIREIYRSAIRLTKLTGVQYVVDHEIPLRSEVVCGLHVPWNLQVITQEANLEKSNKLDPST